MELPNENEFSETYYKEFFDYHKQNPEVWVMFKRKALEAIRKGFEHYGSKGIFEIIRWEMGGNIKADGFKLNNLYTPYYARLFEREYPQYRGFFRNRKTSKTI